jgi:hypothetical protein
MRRKAEVDFRPMAGPFKCSQLAKEIISTTRLHVKLFQLRNLLNKAMCMEL